MKFFEAFAQRLPDPRPAQAGPVHARHAGGVPAGRPHSHARHQHAPLGRVPQSRKSGGIFGFFDLFAGGNIRRLTIFALGIMPYITASIILQLLTVVVPTLEKLQKEGELGRRKITQWTRYLTIALSIIQSFGIAQGLASTCERRIRRSTPASDSCC